MKRLILILTLGLAGCASEPKRSAPEVEWFSRMHKLSATHLNLYGLAGDPRTISNPEHRNGVEAQLKQFAEIGRELAADPKAPDADPLIKYSATKFAQHSNQAYKAFKAGDFAWTRFEIGRSTDQCIACHTRADRGAKDFALAWKPQLLNLSRTQRIEFWLANRQYAMALTEAQQMAADESQAIADPIPWMQALEKVMAMVVRVEGSNRAAEILTTNALNNKMIPFYARADLLDWRKDILSWKKQGPLGNDRARLKLAQSLLNAQNSLSRTPRGYFISNLRASALLHQLLENSKFALYADTLEASGIVSENLGEATLANYYYETCIRELPHSTVAERCFGKLYTSLRKNDPFFESNFAEANAMQSNLSELRELAGPGDISRRNRNQSDKRDDVPGH